MAHPDEPELRLEDAERHLEARRHEEDRGQKADRGVLHGVHQALREGSPQHVLAQEEAGLAATTRV